MNPRTIGLSPPVHPISVPGMFAIAILTVTVAGSIPSVNSESPSPVSRHAPTMRYIPLPARSESPASANIFITRRFLGSECPLLSASATGMWNVPGFLTVSDPGLSSTLTPQLPL